MSLKQESWLENKRGQRLYTVSYTATPDAQTKPRGRLFWHHGLAEHVTRYEKVFLRMADAGIDVYSFDAHGHGKSDPVAKAERALIMDYRHLVEDFFLYADSVLQHLSSADSLPAFVGGHSMGGTVACLAALERQDMWKGLLLQSAAVDVEWTTILRIQASVGGLMAALIPRARIVPAVRIEDISPDPEVIQDYLEDPLVTKGNVCAKTGNELLKSFKLLGKEGGKLKLALYGSHGTQDRCTSRSAAKALLDKSSSTDKTWHEVEGGYHELMKGATAEDETDRMTEWMLKRCDN